MKFNHLNVPTHWRNYWSRYPEGHTILEALISWVSQVDSMVDNQNKLNDNVAQFRNEIDDFVGRFDERLQSEVTQTLNDWQTSGFLDVVISEALQWQLDDYIATNEQDKLSLTAQLQQTEQELSLQLAQNATNIQQFRHLVTDGDWTLAFKEAITLGYEILIPNIGEEYIITETLTVNQSIRGVNQPIIRIVNGEGQEENRLFNVYKTDDKIINISGLHLIGTYNNGEIGEQAHFVYIDQSSHVNVFDNIFEKPYGDCVYIGSTDPAKFSYNINVFRNKMINPRRCGVAVVHAKKVTITDNDFVDENGYVAIIDIEPNKIGNDVVEDVYIARNQVETDYYFINILNPIETIITNLVIENNSGMARVFIRASRGQHKQVSVVNNNFYGEGRFLLLADIDDLIVKDNYVEGDIASQLSRCVAPIITNNLFNIKSSIVSNLVLFDCEKTTVSNNVFKGSYSSNGSFTITSFTEPTSGHMFLNNQILDSDYGIVINDHAITESLFSNNIIESARRGINVPASAVGSGINIDNSNVFRGEGQPVVGYDNIEKWTNPEVRIKGIGVYWRSTIPVDGDWVRGDVIYKVTPLPGQHLGWVCVESGTPGTWKGFGMVEE